MEYTVVEDHNREGLIRKVAELIRQGWKPLGGIAVGSTEPTLRGRFHWIGGARCISQY